jgi:hypothetical protein
MRVHRPLLLTCSHRVRADDQAADSTALLLGTTVVLAFVATYLTFLIKRFVY